MGEKRSRTIRIPTYILDPCTVIDFGQVLAGVVTTAFVGLGYYIGTKDRLSEQNVVLPKDKAMPWQNEGAQDDGDLFKYKVSLNSVTEG